MCIHKRRERERERERERVRKTVRERDRKKKRERERESNDVHEDPSAQSLRDLVPVGSDNTFSGNGFSCKAQQANAQSFDLLTDQRTHILPERKHP